MVDPSRKRGSGVIKAMREKEKRAQAWWFLDKQVGIPYPPSGCKRRRDWNPDPLVEKVPGVEIKVSWT
jgi:hypothetical protein